MQERYKKSKFFVCFDMFHIPCIIQIHNIQITNKIHFNVRNVFYSQCSYQHVLPVVMAILKMMLLLQEYKGANVISCVTVTP